MTISTQLAKALFLVLLLMTIKTCYPNNNSLFVSIAGPNPVYEQTTHIYTASTPLSSGYVWSVVGGTIIYSTPTEVQITWNSLPPRQSSFSGSVRILDANSLTVAQLRVFVYLPPIQGGHITPKEQNVVTGFITQLICSAPLGFCTGGFTYQWEQSTDNIVFTAIPGATTENFQPSHSFGTIYFRRRVNCGIERVGFSDTAIVEVTFAYNNFIKVRNFLKAGITDTMAANSINSSLEVQQVGQFYDGLGRIVQTVNMKMTPLDKDLTTIVEYDEFDRVLRSYLPYVDPSGEGNFKQNAENSQNVYNTTQFPGEQFYYSRTEYERSSLNRVLATYAPGLNWTGSNRGISTQYLCNTSADSVRIWNISSVVGAMPVDSGRYNPGQLYKTITIDEHGRQTVEYKDKEGNLVLKKSQLSNNPGTGHSGWLCTYYVYDKLNRLRFVIQPKGVQALAINNWQLTTPVAYELCFRYDYDAHNRMVIKKVPGAGEVWMVYDLRDRLVMTQDSVLRQQGKWQVTEYDDLNRPWRTGVLTDANNRVYHQTIAYTTNYPPTSTNYEVLTQTFYDDYSWVATSGTTLSATMDVSNTGNSNYFITSYNSSPSFAVAVAPDYQVKGMVTGTKLKVLGGSPDQYLQTVVFYDNRGRTIQTQSINVTGGKDIVSTQYDFSGKTLRILSQHQKSGNNPQSHIVLTKMTYDHAGRLLEIRKKVNNTAETVIATQEYDELGQLAKKTLGDNIDTLRFDYNIRGWLLGMNRNFVRNSAVNKFGFELGYDKRASVITGVSYIDSQYNGNISGMIWKSIGDKERRKYDFGYDNANRLSKADFEQLADNLCTPGSTVDFSVKNLSYDANGNILAMDQRGWQLGGSATIDSLLYTYYDNSNRLKNVIDRKNDTATKLGDFRSSKLYMDNLGGSKNTSAVDYAYDGNGNLTKDVNKDIGNSSIEGIVYNHLDLPATITVRNASGVKGTISYLYDATGNKLKKLVQEAGHPDKYTLYLGEFVYENDTLQFIGHEEGRVRYAKRYFTNGTSEYQFVYDYFVKDHLGNIRMVLTEQKDTAVYRATMEATYRSKEDALFANIPQTAYATSLVPGGYPTDATTSPNDSLVRLNGSLRKVGPALVLKVMSGDKVDIAVKSFYRSGGVTGGTSDPLADILTSLAGGIVGTAGEGKGTLSQLGNTSTSPLLGVLNTFRADNNPVQPSKPKAYLNWIMLDEQFNYVCGDPQSGALPVGNPDVLNTLAYSGIEVSKNGFLYIYVSNETENKDVFFDNLSVNHYAGPVLEETHYYPFGLTMAGISSKALGFGSIESKNKYNGKEQQNKEFRDGSGLEWYDYGARMYDVQIGRWHRIDNKVELYKNLTPFAYVANQPINAIDPDGNLIIFINGLTLNSTQKGTEWYWRQYKNMRIYDRYPDPADWPLDRGDSHIEPVQTGRAFDLEVSTQLGDEHLMYVDGHQGQRAGSRREAGRRKGYENAPAIIESLHRTDGVIDESIKVITHSMGGVYGDGYIAGIRQYLNEHPELKKQVIISLIADFDPYQASEINNDGKTKKQQYTHRGKGSSTGWLANEKEKGDYEYYESPTTGDHSVFSFFNDISTLKGGTYIWNAQTQQWEYKKPKDKK